MYINYPIKYAPQFVNNKYPNLNMQLLPFTPDTYLAMSILIETLSTTSLKMVLKNNLWYIPAYTGYFISFYLFPKSLTKYPLSVAYTIWCGFGIVFTLLADKFIFREYLKWKNIIGSIIVIIGIFVTKY